jgi:hypothetical protein
MKVTVYKNTKFLNGHRKSVKEEAKEEAKKRSKGHLQKAFLERREAVIWEIIIANYVVEELSES